MKKIISLLSAMCVCIIVNAQILDTVLARNVQFQGDDWCYFAFYLKGGDSSAIALNKRITAKAQTVTNPNFNTQITIDSIPGPLLLQFYAIIRSLPSAEAEFIGTNIVTVIRAIPNAALQYFVGQFDAIPPLDAIRKRTIGKNIILDK